MNGSCQLKYTIFLIGFFLIIITPHGNVTIKSWDCAGKDPLMWDRTKGKNGGPGASCKCPCKDAKHMGVKGKYYTSYNANIWYNFPGETGKYKVTIHYQGDGDGKAPFKISFGSKKVGEGLIGTRSGKQTFGPAELKKGDKVNVWIKSDYSLHKEKKHGNYGRFSQLVFTKTGESVSLQKPMIESKMPQSIILMENGQVIFQNGDSPAARSKLFVNGQMGAYK